MNLEEIRKELIEKLTEKRYTHSLNVMEKCEELAKIYKEDIEKAKLVGLAHDIAKEMSIEEMFEYVKNNNIEIDEIEKANPKLLHAKIGADICKKEYNFSEEMAKAIEAHTTGKPNMSKLAKILYISDAISKERTGGYVAKARKLATKDLDKTMVYLLETFIEDCKKRGKQIHTDAEKTIKSIKIM